MIVEAWDRDNGTHSNGEDRPAHCFKHTLVQQMNYLKGAIRSFVEEKDNADSFGPCHLSWLQTLF